MLIMCVGIWELHQWGYIPWMLEYVHFRITKCTSTVLNVYYYMGEAWRDAWFMQNLYHVYDYNAMHFYVLNCMALLHMHGASNFLIYIF